MPRRELSCPAAFARMVSFATVMCVLFTAALIGCAQPRTTEPQADYNTLDDDAFLAYLPDQPLVSVEEAYRAMVILAQGQDPFDSFEERRDWLIGQDIARSAWGLDPGDCIDQGSLAFMVCQIMKVKGGVNRVIFGTWGLGDRRYAYRELVYRGLIPELQTDYLPTTGGEFVHVLGLADEYMAEKGLYEAEPVDLTPPG